MTKCFTDVTTFMRAVDQITPATPTLVESDQAKLYKSLMKEEFEEFLEADSQHDDVERLDACFDLIWVTIGYMISRGWDCETSWDEGALSNLSKIDKETGKVRRREDGKVLKPEGWEPPNFKKFVRD